MILITGANGFVGKSLCLLLENREHSILRSQKRMNTSDWSQELNSVNITIHLAARVHILHDCARNPFAEFKAINVVGTLNLARQSAAAGVKRFIFLSSIGVNGAVTTLNNTFTNDDKPAPHSLYAISKHEAEIGLRKIAIETGMQVVIIRPPLIYGANAPGNFGSLLRIIKRGLPLPLGAVTQNQRSFVALDNLVDLILTCINHPNAANQTFLVSDGEDVSTTDLLRKMALAQGVTSRLLPVPVALLNLCAKLIGKQAMAQRLLGNLQVDISHTQKLLNWKPIISLDEGLRRAVTKLKK